MTKVLAVLAVAAILIGCTPKESQGQGFYVGPTPVAPVYYPGVYRTPWFPGKFFTNAPRWAYYGVPVVQPVQPYILRAVPLVPADQVQQQ